MKINNKIAKWLLIIIGTGTGLYFMSIIVGMSIFFFGIFDLTDYTDLVGNYASKEQEIRELKRYVNSITPPGKSVHIEFDSDDELEGFGIVENGRYTYNSHVYLGSLKAYTLLQKLGWDLETLDSLKTKLDKADCISITSGEPSKIGYQRDGTGIYFYNLFENPLTDSLKIHYNDSCRYVVFSSKVVLEYNGGVFGSQCFPDFRRHSK